jgi:hypothetical protein
MSQIDPERIQGAFNEHEAELTLLRNLVVALVDAHPNRQKVVANFQREVEGYCRSAPPGTDSEYLVEVRARLQMYLQLLAQP